MIFRLRFNFSRSCSLFKLKEVDISSILHVSVLTLQLNKARRSLYGLWSTSGMWGTFAICDPSLTVMDHEGTCGKLGCVTCCLAAYKSNVQQNFSLFFAHEI